MREDEEEEIVFTVEPTPEEGERRGKMRHSLSLPLPRSLSQLCLCLYLCLSIPLLPPSHRRPPAVSDVATLSRFTTSCMLGRASTQGTLHSCAS